MAAIWFTALADVPESVGYVRFDGATVVSTRIRCTAAPSPRPLSQTGPGSIVDRAEPHRVVNFINVVGCGTGWSSPIRQNCRQVIESDTSPHNDSNPTDSGTSKTSTAGSPIGVDGRPILGSKNGTNGVKKTDRPTTRPPEPTPPGAGAVPPAGSLPTTSADQLPAQHEWSQSLLAQGQDHSPLSEPVSALDTPRLFQGEVTKQKVPCTTLLSLHWDGATAIPETVELDLVGFELLLNGAARSRGSRLAGGHPEGLARGRWHHVGSGCRSCRLRSEHEVDRGSHRRAEWLSARLSRRSRPRLRGEPRPG